MHRDYNSTGSVQVSVFRNRIVVRNPGTLPVELTKADLMKEHGSYPHNPYLAEVMYQMGYIEKYGTGITENIRRMLEARLLAPDIDLSAEFITTIWREEGNANVATGDPNIATGGSNIATCDSNIATIKPNIATQVRNGTANIATCDTSIATDVDKINNNIATDHLSENKRIIDGIVRSKVKRRMSRGLIQECIIEACIVDHTIDELSALLNDSNHDSQRLIDFGYDLSRSCDEIRPGYSFDESCQGTVPQAITAFLESTDFENCIRLGVSLGGDSDTDCFFSLAVNRRQGAKGDSLSRGSGGGWWL